MNRSAWIALVALVGCSSSSAVRTLRPGDGGADGTLPDGAPLPDHFGDRCNVVAPQVGDCSAVREQVRAASDAYPYEYGVFCGFTAWDDAGSPVSGHCSFNCQAAELADACGELGGTCVAPHAGAVTRLCCPAGEDCSRL